MIEGYDRMTTIATDGKAMAADGRLVMGDRILKEDDDKIVKLFVEKAGETLLVGCSGAVVHMQSLLEYISESYVGDSVFLRTNVYNPEEDFGDEAPHPSETHALILTEQGRVFMAGYAESVLEVRKTMATGSGGDIALGAMLAGKTPGEAVLIASRVDLNTNGNVKEIRIA